MGSLDVDSLFTNIPLEETIDICTNTLFENMEKIEGLSKIEFKELLSLATKESYLIISSNYQHFHNTSYSDRSNSSIEIYSVFK